LAYLIDANIAIHARDGSDAVLAKLAERDGQVSLSTCALPSWRGAFTKTLALPQYDRTDWRFCCALPFDASAAVVYSRIIAQCGWASTPDCDRMIATHAISSHSVLVTNNLADFSDVPGLSMENWVV
jgi:tRNA(fMet)-specific endonuclease VapC